MTAAIVAPLPVPSMSDVSICDPSVEARKRRREILSSQRCLVPDVVTSVEPVPKKRKVSTDETIAKPSAIVASKNSKKPQMKYDPDVPMTKEEAAVWRREQRRKRNRESAAASRQRQRDRINELESKVDDWKLKYEAMMAKIRHLERVTGSPPSPELENTGIVTTSRPSTPPPMAVQTVTPRASPTSTTSLVSLTGKVMDQSEDVVTDEEQEEPPKMISQQALFRIIHTNIDKEHNFRTVLPHSTELVLCLS